MNPLPPLPGTQVIETIDGPVTRVNSFPRVNFFAPIGQPVSCDMRGATTSLTQDEDGAWIVLGEVDIGGVVMGADELSALPGFTEFFPALLQAGLAKLIPPPPVEPEEKPAPTRS